MESYDQIVKKLIKIIQLKSDDNVKQLEDLWETFEKSNLYQNELKRSLQIDQSLASKESDNPSKKPKFSNISHSSKNRSKNINSSSDSAEQSSSSSFSTIGSNSGKSPELTDVFDDEMLELNLTCFVCKQIYQEKDNKLIECNCCSKLYHQKCHKPNIEEAKNFSKNQQENKISWFIEKCQSCSNIVNEDDEQTRMSPNGKEQIKGLAGLATKFSNSKVTRNGDNKNSKTSGNGIQQNQKSVFNLPPISSSIKK